MTRELRNAVSRLRKLENAVFEGKITSCTSCIVSLSFANHHYYDHDHNTVNVSVSKFDEDGIMGLMYWQMTDSICEENGDMDNKCSHEELLQRISDFIGYPI